MKTEKPLLLAKMKPQAPITTLSPNPLKLRANAGGNSFLNDEAQLFPRNGMRSPQLTALSVQVVVQGGDPGEAQRT